MKWKINHQQTNINSKKLKRYNEAEEYYQKFDGKFPGSKFAKEAEGLRENVERYQRRLEKEAAERQQEKMLSTIRKSVNTVLESNDETAREKAYDKALDTYKELQDTYPESAVLPEADALFKQIEDEQGKD